MRLRDHFMGRRTTTSPNGKREREIKFYCDERMYDTIVAFAHVANKTKSEFVEQLCHFALFGLYGEPNSSRIHDETEGRQSGRSEDDE